MSINRLDLAVRTYRTHTTGRFPRTYPGPTAVSERFPGAGDSMAVLCHAVSCPLCHSRIATVHHVMAHCCPACHGHIATACCPIACCCLMCRCCAAACRGMTCCHSTCRMSWCGMLCHGTLLPSMSRVMAWCMAMSWWGVVCCVVPGMSWFCRCCVLCHGAVHGHVGSGQVIAQQEATQCVCHSRTAACTTW